MFNTDKLDWFNHQYLQRLSDDALIAAIRPWLAAADLWTDDLAGDRRIWFAEVLALLRPRARKLGDFVEAARPFLRAPASFEAEGTAKHLAAPGLAAHLAALREGFAALPDFAEPELERALRGIADARGIKAGVLIHATRMAMTGRTVSPGLFEMLRLLGRAEVLSRLDRLAAGL